MLTSTIFATGAVVAAMIDRLLIERKSIELVELGSPTLRDEFIDFPMKYISLSKKLRGAQVEYWLFNNNDPSHIFSGRHRTLDLANPGVNSEYLSFKREYMVDGCLTLAVRITHGDCRWNPLYRLFPLQSTVKKQITIEQGAPHEQ